MKKNCTQCLAEFEITPDDLKFYDKVSPVFGGREYSLPPPTMCPECRQQRRLQWANIQKLYFRVCHKSNKKILSTYSPESPVQVYNVSYWWGDQWNPTEYGREFNFSEPFFDQFSRLLLSVPHPALQTLWNSLENSEYINYASYVKNCYLVFHSTFSEDCFYDFGIKYCKNVVDCLHCQNSELLYESIDCSSCYNIQYSKNCKDCRDSFFLENCVGCKSCFGCVGLLHKSFYAFNTFIGEEKFLLLKKKFQEEGYASVEKYFKDFTQFKIQYPVKENINIQCEDSRGDNLQNCKNVSHSFDVIGGKDCKFCERIYNDLQDCYDMDQFGEKAELVYESECSGVNLYHILFCVKCRNNVSNLMYCFACFSSENCFGCVGLKRRQYCILNTQYSKEEYEELMPKIIEHMSKTGEWGEFFPVSISPYAYNETVAQEYFPLSKEEVIQRGWKWKEEEAPDYSGVTKKIPASKLPHTIEEIPDDILNWAILCEESGKPFKIQKLELEFYRRMNIPIPHFHPDVRHRKRIGLRNPRKLWDRNCAKCSQEIQTTYAPERPEVVYCEQCYLKDMY